MLAMRSEIEMTTRGRESIQLNSRSDMANVFKIQEDHETAGRENQRAERRLAVDAGPEPILNIVAISAFATRGPLIFLPAKHHTAFTALS